MSPMTMIEPFYTVGIPILTSQNDEEFGEEIVQLFIAHVNAMCHGENPTLMQVANSSVLKLMGIAS